MIYKLLTRSLTRRYRTPFRAYFGPASAASYILSEQINTTFPIGIQPLVFSKRRYSCYGEMSPKIEIVYYEEIKGLPKHPKVLLIDVREPDELRQTGIIPTSINIPLARVENELGKDLKTEEFKRRYSRDKPCKNTVIIFHCRSGRRSQEAAECAVALGYTNVKNYKGSWNDWAEREGLPH